MKIKHIRALGKTFDARRTNYGQDSYGKKMSRCALMWILFRLKIKSAGEEEM